MVRSLKLLLVGLASFLVTLVASAQDLRDPTRPAIASMQGSAAEELEHVPVLQSVLISPTRKFAVIDGKTVRLNAQFGDQVLVKLTETEAVLKRGRELQVLKLFPEVDKKIVRSAKKMN